MLIASSVAYETEGDDESPDPILASYDFEDEDNPAEHPAPLDPPPKMKRRRKGGTSFNKKPKGRQQGSATIPISPTSRKRKPRQPRQRKPIIPAQWNKVDCCVFSRSVRCASASHSSTCTC